MLCEPGEREALWPAGRRGYFEEISVCLRLWGAVGQQPNHSIDAEISELLQSNIVISANEALKRKELQDEIDSLRKQESELKKQISAAEKNIENYLKVTAGKTLEDAQIESQSLTAHIRRINDKQAYLKLPSVISALKAEIILLQSTIKDLEVKQLDIEKLRETQS